MIKIADSLPTRFTEIDEYLQAQFDAIKENPNGNKVSNDIKPAVWFKGFYKVSDEHKLNEILSL